MNVIRYLLFFVLAFLYTSMFRVSPAYGFICSSPTYCIQVNPGQTRTVSWCRAFQTYDNDTGMYVYHRLDCQVNKGILPAQCNPNNILCRSIDDNPQIGQLTDTIFSAIPLNTNMNNVLAGWDNSMCGSEPQNCNQGFGTLQHCDDYIGNPSCSGIPCRCRPNNTYGGNCSSSCSGGGGGGGGPTATPTPTPSPFCHLLCPGQESKVGQINGAGGGNGALPITVQPTPILPTQARGFLNFLGFNNFQCSALDDAKGGVIACPTPIGGNPGGYGLTSQFTYPTPTTNPLRYNMLCGNNTHTYTAVATSSTMSGPGGSGIGNGGTITPTAGPTVRPGLYPPNCSLAGPTPTPDPSNPGDVQAGGAKGAGSGQVSGQLSCSCSVAVGCQTSLQSLPSQTGSSCDTNCDFTVSPETPEFGEVTTFTASGSGVDGGSTFSFDDNSDAVAANGGPVNHTFANSGVYNVALSCSGGSQVCTRTVNNYCGPLSWYKIKNASFHKNGNLNDPIPTGVQQYDADDTTESLVSIGNPGLVTTNGSITTGAGNLSIPNWRTTVYTPNIIYSATAYADYLVGRKTYVTVVDDNSNGVIDSNELTADAINYIVGNYTIDNNSVQSKAPIVLVVKGNLTIDVQNNDEFNPPDKAMTLVATGTLRIHSHMDRLNGIFIATNVDLAYDTTSATNPLKVVGNLISHNSMDLKKRIRPDGEKPSLFVIQDYEQYMKVLHMLGTRRYTQTELRP